MRHLEGGGEPHHEAIDSQCNDAENSAAVITEDHPLLRRSKEDQDPVLHAKRLKASAKNKIKIISKFRGNGMGELRFGDGSLSLQAKRGKNDSF